MINEYPFLRRKHYNNFHSCQPHQLKLSLELCIVILDSPISRLHVLHVNNISFSWPGKGKGNPLIFLYIYFMIGGFLVFLARKVDMKK